MDLLSIYPVSKDCQACKSVSSVAVSTGHHFPHHTYAAFADQRPGTAAMPQVRERRARGRRTSGSRQSVCRADLVSHLFM